MINIRFYFFAVFSLLAGPGFAQNQCSVLFSNTQSYTNLRLEAIELAKKAHASQIYALNTPYVYHLEQVEKVLNRFFKKKMETEQFQKLKIAAWLHDIIEDTPITYKMLKKQFGREMAQIVFAMTKPPKYYSNSMHQRIYYAKLRVTPDAFLLKLADRIANVEQGIKERHVYEKYYNDYLFWQKQNPRLSDTEKVLFEFLGELLAL